MAKWKCPEDAGPGVSIGGQWFENKDGFIETPEGEMFALALGPHGYIHVPPTAEELAAAAAEAQAAEDARLAEEAAAARREADAKAAEEAAAQEAADKAATGEAAAKAADGEADTAKTGKKK